MYQFNTITLSLVLPLIHLKKNDFERLTHVKSIYLKGLELKGEFFFQPMMHPGMPQNMGFTGNFPMQSTGMVSLY